MPGKYRRKKHMLGSRTYRPPTRSFKGAHCPRFPEKDLIPSIATISGKVYNSADAQSIIGPSAPKLAAEAFAAAAAAAAEAAAALKKAKARPVPRDDDEKPKKRKRGRPSKSDKAKELAAAAAAAKKKKKKKKKKKDKEEEEEEDDDTLYCYCKSKFTGAFMVGCDGPWNGWYHPKC